MKKTLRTIFIAIFGLFAAVALAIVIAPTFFKEKLVAVVKTEINKQVEGEVNFSDVDVTWWSTFPDIAVELEDLQVSGYKSDSLQADLLTAESLLLGLDFMSVWSQGDSVEIKTLSIQEPHVFVAIDETGRANYDLMKASSANSSSQESSGIKFDLSDYEIVNANLRYFDRQSGVDAQLKSVNHSGDLTYDNNNLLLDAEVTADEVSFIQGSVPLLDKTKLDFAGELNLDLEEKKYSFLENDLTLNALQLFFEGDIDQNADDIIFNVAVKTRKNTFKSILSVLPNMYTSDFESIKTSGNLALDGRIDGALNVDKNQYPQYSFNLEIDDGFFQLPNKSQAVSDIFIKSKINNKNGGPDPSHIEVPVFHFTMNGEEINGKIDIENQGSNQLFDGEIKGKLDLADVQDAYPMPDVEMMSGVIDVDAKFKGDSKSAQAKNMSNLDYSGFIKGEQVKVKMTGQPALALNNFDSELKDDQVLVDKMSGQYGATDFVGEASLSPISSLIADNATPVKITADVKGRSLNIDEFMASESNTVDDDENAPTEENLLIKNLEFDIDASYDEIQYDSYEITDASAEVDGSLSRVNLKSFNGNVNQAPVKASGVLSDIYDYTYRNGTLKGDLKVASTSFDADQWMMEEETTSASTSEATSYAVIPERMDLKINIDVDELNYDDIDIRDARGDVVMRDQRIEFDGVKGKAMGGDFGLDGYYAHDGTGDPLFKLAYDVSQFSFEQTFEQVESAKFILPIIQFIQGQFNSNMTFEGKLQPGYMPDLSSIDGEGLLETLHGRIMGNQTVDQISSLLQIDDMKRMALDKSRNRFKIENGGLTVQPFEESFEDIHALISGSHKLTGDMDYKMELTIPSEKFNVKGFPLDIKKQFDSVQKQLQKFGLPLENTESLRVDVLITGSTTNPKVSLKLVDFSKKSVKDAVKNAANEVVQQAKDSVTNAATSKIIDVVQGDKKDSTQTSVKEAVKVRVKTEVNQKIEEEVKPVKDTLVAKAEEAVKDKISDELKDKVDDEVKDKAEDLLDKYNPFKKKKKEGG